MATTGWTLLSKHGQVLVYLARFPDAAQRDISRELSIDLRTLARIIRDLEEGEYVTIRKQGRRNLYRVNPEMRLRTEFLRDVQLKEVLVALAPPQPAGPLPNLASRALHAGAPFLLPLTLLTS